MEKIIAYSQQLSRCLIRFPIQAYRLLLSPYLGPACRYSPSCSEYALDAIQRWGVLKGMWFVVYRILSCHPWAKGGYDPVPPITKRCAGRSNPSNRGKL